MTVISAAKTKIMRLVLTVLALVMLAPAALAVQGTVTGGKINPMPIAIAPFIPGGGAEDAAATVAGVIANDLTRSGYFNALPPNSFIEQITDFSATPRFADWRQVMAKALVTGQTYADSGGRVRIEFKLFDVNSGQLLAGQQFTASKGNVRRVGHRIADMVYKALLGIDGYFDTRIVYVSESGPKDKRVKKLAIMDQDGYNPRVLLDTGEIILTPRFSPTSQEITFMAIGKDEPRVFIYNVDTKQREIVGSFPNMSFAPRFSPDGQRVIMSLQSDDGLNANIFEMDLRSRNTRQLTNEAAINTAPSYAPDGGKITFESDRSGGQQIYVMNADGSGQNRISFGKGRYSTPVWSPDGQYIAFTKQAEGRFAIGVMKPDGSGERILTEGYHNEGPTWAPNGRVLMFFRDTPGDSAGPQLWSVDITGYNEQRVPTDGFASDPSWSPRLN
ncbi:MAG TPA: Tol-Pal system beta propeller repeat protein TolB [Aestuariivirga sp.]|nr:Tol-Pal system beta propeller repeat protein TolB [Aestuariivirga sp.]